MQVLLTGVLPFSGSIHSENIPVSIPVSKASFVRQPNTVVPTVTHKVIREKLFKCAFVLGP